MKDLLLYRIKHVNLVYTAVKNATLYLFKFVKFNVLKGILCQIIHVSPVQDIVFNVNLLLIV
jgi:hypothetical protein